MKEYARLVASAAVSAGVNALGLIRGRGRGPERILVVKLDHVGDVILATPAIHALRDAHPDAVIDVLLGTGSSFVLADHPVVNRVLEYDSRQFRRGPVEGLQTSLGEIVTDSYTTLVELRGGTETLLLPFRIGARRRVDLGTARLRHWIARHLDGRPPMHEVETNLEIVRPLLTREIRERVRDATPERAPLSVVLAPGAGRSLERKLESVGMNPTERIVCVYPGASWRRRAWDPSRFAAIADWVQAHYHAQVVLVGSESERDIEAAVRAKIQGAQIYCLTGVITWNELHALLERSMLFVGNDGGPAHLAAAAGVSSVVLLGPTDPDRFRPWSERSLVLQQGPPGRARVAPKNCRVNDIPVEDVIAAVSRLLDVPTRAADLASRRAATGDLAP